MSSTDCALIGNTCTSNSDCCTQYGLSCNNGSCISCIGQICDPTDSATTCPGMVCQSAIDPTDTNYYWQPVSCQTSDNCPDGYVCQQSEGASSYCVPPTESTMELVLWIILIIILIVILVVVIRVIYVYYKKRQTK